MDGKRAVPAAQRRPSTQSACTRRSSGADPAAGTIGRVAVQLATAETSLGRSFTFEYHLSPEVVSIQPSFGPVAGGAKLRLSGFNFFKGSKLVDALTGPRYKGKLAKDTPIKTRAEAAKLAQELLRVGFIHRSQRFQHAHSRRWELELFQGPFEEDGLFTWVYEGETW